MWFATYSDEKIAKNERFTGEHREYRKTLARPDSQQKRRSGYSRVGMYSNCTVPLSYFNEQLGRRAFSRTVINFLSLLKSSIFKIPRKF